SIGAHDRSELTVPTPLEGPRLPRDRVPPNQVAVSVIVVVNGPVATDSAQQSTARPVASIFATLCGIDVAYGVSDSPLARSVATIRGNEVTMEIMAIAMASARQRVDLTFEAGVCPDIAKVTSHSLTIPYLVLDRPSQWIASP